MRRIVTLLPSATELVAALGLLPDLVGRSHECDYPASVTALPVCTAPRFNPIGSTAEIHLRVTELLRSALSVYDVLTPVLEQLQPTHIITQAQCEVCAVSLSEVEVAVRQLTGIQPQVISLAPTCLDDFWSDIRRAAAALEVDPQPLLDQLQQRVRHIQLQAQNQSRPTVGCIEWSEPLMAAGNWIPELIVLAGGESCFGTVGQHSPWLRWEELQAADPEVLILMPCGYDLAKTAVDAATLAADPRWSALRAVQARQVYLTDGNAYFNRPGPRLVDSLEILAEILHPEMGLPRYRGGGWRPWIEHDLV